MPAITAVEMLRSGVRSGINNFFQFTTDFDVTGRTGSPVTVVGDASSAGVSRRNNRGTYILLNIAAGDVTSGSATITIGTGTTTPNLDREYTYMVTWANGVFAAPTEITGPALPTPTISPVATSLQNGGTTTVNITFPSSVTGFTANSVSVSAGSISGFTGSGRNYSFTLTAPNSGTGTINIDIAGTSSWEAATRATVSYAPTTPARTVTITPTSARIQRGQSTTVRITFSGTGTVNGFTNSDTEVSAGTKSGFARSGNTGRVFIFTLTAPSSGTGTITIRVPANAISNAEGNTAASATVAYVAPPVQPPTGTLSIEDIDEQFVTVGTKGYRLVIDIGGTPDRATARGLTEGFYQHWDNTNKQLHILSQEVTRLIKGVIWDIEAVKGSERLDKQIKYNVVRAAPIFQQLPRIHLYRGVPLNFDILITNIPDVLNPETLLVSLKSELEAYGLNFQGNIPLTANYPSNRDTLQILVPDETGETSEMHDYAYQIESGNPPAIGTPVFTPKGGYGTLEFTDVTHALGYEWTLQEGDADRVDWSVFDSTRQLIDPDTVEVTPGQFQVTIKFPNIAGASSYEYRLESDDHEVDWKKFTGTLANGMITTIIPDLQDGVQYTLRLRVASPWIGTPISLTVYGGRIFYLLNNVGNDTQIFVAHTGVARGGRAELLKRIDLPSHTPRNRNYQGLAVAGTTAYLSDSSNNIRVLNIDVNDGETASPIRSFTAPTENSFPTFLTIKNNILYSASSLHRGKIYSFLATTANNTRAVLINEYTVQTGGVDGGLRIAARDDFIVAVGHWSGNLGMNLGIYPINPSNFSRIAPLISIIVPTNPFTLWQRSPVEYLDGNIYLCNSRTDQIAIMPDTTTGADLTTTDGIDIEKVKLIRFPVHASNITDMAISE